MDGLAQEKPEMHVKLLPGCSRQLVTSRNVKDDRNTQGTNLANEIVVFLLFFYQLHLVITVLPMVCWAST